ncbi:MAG: hypothetical protein RLZZ600_1156 [Actinomycetota bacterium]|jgi:uncharacterized protein YdhG (YjbR/CyaY superfamily)
MHMSSADIDAYFAAQVEPQRSTLEATRAIILELYPDAQQTISYGMPAFTVDGVIVAGLAATKKGISYYPHSGQVLPAAGQAVAAYGQTKGALHAPADKPLPKELIAQLIDIKLAQSQK